MVDADGLNCGLSHEGQCPGLAATLGQSFLPVELEIHHRGVARVIV
jgi:hypothetical protein